MCVFKETEKKKENRIAEKRQTRETKLHYTDTEQKKYMIKSTRMCAHNNRLTRGIKRVRQFL
jgi:hypothetical protein